MFGISLARIVAGLAVVAALLGLGAYLASRHYAPEVAGLNQKLGAANQALSDDKAAYATLTAQAGAQNVAIVGLQKAADARAVSAAVAISAAQATSAKYQAEANALLASKPAQGANLCEAARALIDSQVKEDHAQ